MRCRSYRADAHSGDGVGAELSECDGVVGPLLTLLQVQYLSSGLLQPVRDGVRVAQLTPTCSDTAGWEMKVESTLIFVLEFAEFYSTNSLNFIFMFYRISVQMPSGMSYNT